MAKEGCRYCRTEENGDFPADAKDIIYLDIGKFLGASLYGCCYVHKNELDISFFGAEDFSRTGSAKINYCPMCGRKLNFKEEKYEKQYSKKGFA